MPNEKKTYTYVVVYMKGASLIATEEIVCASQRRDGDFVRFYNAENEMIFMVATGAVITISLKEG